MKLEDVKEIRMCYNEIDVNSHLKENFVIKKILQSKTNNDDLTPCFIKSLQGYPIL